MMKKINREWVAVSVCMFLLACGPTSARAQQPQRKRPPAPQAVKPAVSDFPAPVPNVVGLSIEDAWGVLTKAGLKWKMTYLSEPSPAVLLGHVLAMNPMARSVASKGSVIDLQIPGAAIRQGKANLSASDAARRAGFDLDEGHYEEILRGADILIRTHVARPGPGGGYIPGTPSGGGTFIETSDGATLVMINPDLYVAADIARGALRDVATYPVYALCLRLFSHPSQEGGGLTDSINLFDLGETDVVASMAVTACVRTSKRQLAVVQFRGTDNTNHPTDYLFRWALFKDEQPLKEIDNPPGQRLENRKPSP
jgi:hypothetical protein